MDMVNSCTRRKKVSLFFAVVMLWSQFLPLMAGPEGGQVVRGRAAIEKSGNVTNVRVSSQNAVINWRSFNVNHHETVNIHQLSASSRLLNRITGAGPSNIDGAINANGQVYFVNPAGVYFGHNAVINVGGLYAAAGHIANDDFMAGINRFTSLSGDVISRGQITTDGSAHFIGKRVENIGLIESRNGFISFSSGSEVLIAEEGSSLYVKIDAATTTIDNGSAALDNSGTLQADQGIHLGSGDVYALALSHSGQIAAKEIKIDGGHGHVELAGNLEVEGTIEFITQQAEPFSADAATSGLIFGSTPIALVDPLVLTPTLVDPLVLTPTLDDPIVLIPGDVLPDISRSFITEIEVLTDSLVYFGSIAQNSNFRPLQPVTFMQPNEAVAITRFDKADREALRKLGIFPKDTSILTLEELAAIDNGLFDDIPVPAVDGLGFGTMANFEGISASDYQTTPNRLQAERTSQIIKSCNGISTEEPVDKEQSDFGQAVLSEPARTSRTAEIKNILEESVKLFNKEQGQFTPATYHAVLGSTESDIHVAAHEELKKISTLFINMELLGLNDVELKNSLLSLLRPIASRPLQPEDLLVVVKLIKKSELLSVE